MGWGVATDTNPFVSFLLFLSLVGGGSGSSDDESVNDTEGQIINGDIGNYTLIGGGGDDIMSGGAIGSNVFIYKKGDYGHDTITDFNGEGLFRDKLDLSDLLEYDSSINEIDDFIKFTRVGSGTEIDNVLIEIDVEGLGHFGNDTDVSITMYNTMHGYYIDTMIYDYMVEHINKSLILE